MSNGHKKVDFSLLDLYCRACDEEKCSHDRFINVGEVP